MLTIPIFFPVATALGFDPIWFGVVIVLIGEMGVVNNIRRTVTGNSGPG